MFKRFRLKKILTPIIPLHWNRMVTWGVHWLLTSRADHGSRAINKLFCFDPSNSSFSILKDELPFVWGREAIGRIDSWGQNARGRYLRKQFCRRAIVST